MKIEHDNIHITRGESDSVEIKIWNSDGTPFIMPPVSRPSIRAIAELVKHGNMYEYIFYCPVLGSIELSFAAITQVQVKLLNSNGTTTIGLYIGSAIEVPHVSGQYVISIQTPQPIVSLHIHQSGMSTSFYADGTLATAAFTVRAALYDSVMFNVILNMHAAISRDSVTDYTINGWSKFTSYEILTEVNLSTLRTRLLSRLSSGDILLGKCNGIYYHPVLLKTGTIDIQPYEFSITIPLSTANTDIEAKQYVYDFAAYYGKPDDAIYTSDTLLYKQVHWKRELIKPHKFIVGDSNNA